MNPPQRHTGRIDPARADTDPKTSISPDTAISPDAAAPDTADTGTAAPDAGNSPPVHAAAPAPTGGSSTAAPSPGKAFLLYAAPALFLLAWAVLPVMLGTETFYLRDVLATHLPMRVAQTEALAEGRMPLVDPYRASGQPLAGNPNAVPFYPTVLLGLAADRPAAGALWAMGAHFWLHLLLAVPAFFWLARAWGLPRHAAWAGGVLWATSGFFLSQLSFLNLVAGTALAPAFLAACLRLAEKADAPFRQWGGRLAAAALLWALLVVSGDPTTGAFALGAAVLALAARHLRRPAAGEGTDDAPGAKPALGRAAAALAGVVALGALAAAPQLVEFLRILGTSYRGVYGYSFQAATAASWDPRQALDLLLPLPFGRLDLMGASSFWGGAFYGGAPPYYLSLFPGALLFALMAAAGRPGPREPGRGQPEAPTLPLAVQDRFGGGRLWGIHLWAWGLIAVGLFFAMGRFNPLGSWLYALPGLRYPVKMWLFVALGSTLLASLGFARAFPARGSEAPDGETAGEARKARKRAAVTLLVLGGLSLLAWLVLRFTGGAEGGGITGLLHGWMGEGRPLAHAAAEQARLAGTAFVAAGAAFCLALGVWAAGRAPGEEPERKVRWLTAWSAGLVAVHAAFQLLLLGPLLATDEARLYTEPPPLEENLPDGELTAHGGFAGLLGPSSLGVGAFPDDRGIWLARRAYYEMYPPAGPPAGRRYAFNTSPEGLDGFLTRVTQAAVRSGDDRERLALLGASGVGVLLSGRPLDPAFTAAPRPVLSRVGALSSFGQDLHVYRLTRRADSVQLVGEVTPVPDLTAAYAALTDPAFDPTRRAVVVTGEGAGEADGESLPGTPSVEALAALKSLPSGAGRGRVQVTENEAEALAVEVSSPEGGLLTTDRAWLPLYRAFVDGEEAETLAANMHLLAVPIPAGEHRVELRVDRRPLWVSSAVSMITLLVVLGLGLPAFRARG